MDPTKNKRQAKLVVLIAAACLLVGVPAAYLVWPAESPHSRQAAPIMAAAALGSTPTLQPEKPWMPPQNPPQVAAHAAAEVLRKLEREPDNPALLAEAGNIYLYNRVFAGAVGYYERALRQRDDVAVRNNYASALFYSGDAEAALQQYDRILAADAKNDEALFNRGMVRLRAKDDPGGAVESWRALLKAHPRHRRRADVERLITRAEAAIQLTAK